MAELDAKTKALSIIPHITAALSIIASGHIAFSVFTHPRKRSTSTYHRIMAVMSTCDVITSFAYFFSTWAVPQSVNKGWGNPYHYAAMGNATTCTLQGVGIQFGAVTAYYNVALAIQYILIVKWRISKTVLRNTYDKFLLGIPMIIGVALVIPGLVLKSYGNTNLWCWLATNMTACDKEPVECARLTNIYRFAFYYGPLWLSIFFTTGVQIYIWWTVRLIEKNTFTTMEEKQQRKNSLRMDADALEGDDDGEYGASRYEESNFSSAYRQSQVGYSEFRGASVMSSSVGRSSAGGRYSDSEAYPSASNYSSEADNNRNSQEEREQPLQKVQSGLHVLHEQSSDLEKSFSQSVNSFNTTEEKFVETAEAAALKIEAERAAEKAAGREEGEEDDDDEEAILAMNTQTNSATTKPADEEQPIDSGAPPTVNKKDELKRKNKSRRRRKEDRRKRKMQFFQQSRRILFQSMSYLMIFLLTWLPYTLMNFINLAFKKWFRPSNNGFWLLLLVVTLQPLQGFLNWFVYNMTFLRLFWQNPKKQWFKLRVKYGETFIGRTFFCRCGISKGAFPTEPPPSEQAPPDAGEAAEKGEASPKAVKEDQK